MGVTIGTWPDGAVPGANIAVVILFGLVVLGVFFYFDSIMDYGYLRVTTGNGQPLNMGNN